MTSSEKKLNPLLRLAALSGVETAIKLHIRRGDDLNARDGAGATPLILAAARKKKGAVRLLLDAGANPNLVDLNGMDALAHARAGGCSETIGLLMDAVSWFVSPLVEVTEVFEAGAAENAGGEGAQSEVKSPLISSGVLATTCSDEASAETASALRVMSHEAFVNPVQIAEVHVGRGGCSPVISLDEELLEDGFADDWEAEAGTVAPKGDGTVAILARNVHMAIVRHKVVDRDEDWGDVDISLPARAAPLDRDEGEGPIRAILLSALRHGLVFEQELIQACANVDGSRNQEAEMLLALVVGELGARVVEWSGAESFTMSEASLEEDSLLAEAVTFADELASGANDPFRLYAKDIRGELLSAEDEISLAQQMEEAGRDALKALARWPEGIQLLLDTVEMVRRHEIEPEFICMGPDSASEEIAVADDGGVDDEPVAEQIDTISFLLSLVEAIQTASRDELQCLNALENARLARGFLLKLAESGGAGEAFESFVTAVRRQSVARERIIKSNLRLAWSIAKKYMGSGIPIDDLVQEANLGLMRAVEGYDWRKGFRFSTYATWWIRQKVTRSIADTARVVRAPVHVHEVARKLLRESWRLEAECGVATDIELSLRTGIPLAKVRFLRSTSADIVSLDEPDLETGVLKVELLSAAAEFDPAVIAEHASLRSTLLSMLGELGDREREVIVMRFGLENDDAMTLEEVGLHFGVTRERIRQIESKAMRRLSAEKRKKILAPFLGKDSICLSSEGV